MKVLCFLVLTVGLIATALAATPFDDQKQKQSADRAFTINPYTSRKPYTNVRPRFENGVNKNWHQVQPKVFKPHAVTFVPPYTTKRRFTTKRWDNTPREHPRFTTKSPYTWPYRRFTTVRPKQKTDAIKPKSFYPKQAITVAPSYTTRRFNSWPYTHATRRPLTYVGPNVRAQTSKPVYKSQSKPFYPKNAITIAPSYATKRSHSWSYTRATSRPHANVRLNADAVTFKPVTFYQGQPKPLK